MAPSVEMRMLREARESARVAAEASGSGRRARAPSRKALEASGKMKNEGVQWMTKDKKNEQARLHRELREQRKAAAAAGLKAGQVIEAFAAPLTSTGVNGASACGSGGVPNWRKLTPAETLQAAGRTPAPGEVNEYPRDGESVV